MKEVEGRMGENGGEKGHREGVRMERHSKVAAQRRRNSSEGEQGSSGAATQQREQQRE